MPKLAKVEGEVIVKDGTGQAIEYYEAEFVLDDAVKTGPQARSVIRKGLISERLRKTVQNFRRVRTMQLVSFDRTDAPAEQSELDRLLLRASEMDCIPENIDNYKRPDYKAKALEKAIELAERRAKTAKPDSVKDLGEVA